MMKKLFFIAVFTLTVLLALIVLFLIDRNKGDRSSDNEMLLPCL
jgi:preprotein translocase subunit SecG